ncbi:hypothetical protein ACFQGX_15130 [Nonomuraea dietziae]
MYWIVSGLATSASASATCPGVDSALWLLRDSGSTALQVMVSR